MNLKRFLDCYLFGFIAVFFNFHKKKNQKSFSQKPSSISSIAIIKLVGMGDAILQLPTILALKKKYSKANIEIWTTSATASVFKNQFAIKKVYLVQLKKIFFLIKKMNSYDLVIDFEPFMNFSFLLSRLFVNKKKSILNSIGFDSPLRKAKHPISKPFLHSLHMTKNYYQLVNDFLDTNSKKKIEELSTLHGNEWDKRRAFEIEQYPYPDKKKKVAIAIGAGKVARGRKLPLKTYIKVIEKILLSDSKITVFLVGGQLEKKESIKVINYFFKKKVSLGDRIINLVAELPLGATFELMKDISSFIGNDTGTAHIALAQKCKSILIFGPETEKRYGPLQKSKSIVINKNLPCSPCIEIWKGKNKTCNNPICTKDITAEEIFERFIDLTKTI